VKWERKVTGPTNPTKNRTDLEVFGGGGGGGKEKIKKMEGGENTSCKRGLMGGGNRTELTTGQKTKQAKRIT